MQDGEPVSYIVAVIVDYTIQGPSVTDAPSGAGAGRGRKNAR